MDYSPYREHYLRIARWSFWYGWIWGYALGVATALVTFLITA